MIVEHAIAFMEMLAVELRRVGSCVDPHAGDALRYMAEQCVGQAEEMAARGPNAGSVAINAPAPTGGAVMR